MKGIDGFTHAPGAEISFVLVLSMFTLVHSELLSHPERMSSSPSKGAQERKDVSLEGVPWKQRRAVWKCRKLFLIPIFQFGRKWSSVAVVIFVPFIFIPSSHLVHVLYPYPGHKTVPRLRVFVN